MAYFATLFLALLPSLLAQVDRFGLPACTGADQEQAVRASFVLCHSSSYKVPLWTAYELRPEQLEGTAQRPRHFRRDAELLGSAASDADYRNSGYSRGHMVPAADAAWSEYSMRATFLLSNVIPQTQELNAGLWRHLENVIRRLAASSDSVIVFTGPVFDCKEIERIGPGQVAVPCGVFKVALAMHGESKAVHAFVLPNESGVRELLDHFAVPVKEVERRTGLDFFSAMEKN